MIIKEFNFYLEIPQMKHPGSRLYNNFRLVADDAKIITGEYLRRCAKEAHRTILISNLMFTDRAQKIVTRWCERNINNFDEILLERFADPPVVWNDMFAYLGKPIHAFGYGSPKNYFDVWALLTSRLSTWPSPDEVIRPEMVDKSYLCYNRKPTTHRKWLYQTFESAQCLDKGIFTLGSLHAKERRFHVDNPDDYYAEDIPDDHNYTTSPAEISGDWGIPNDVFTVGPLNIWNRCLFNIVTETIYNITPWGFCSEKIFKPLIGCRPFVVYSLDGGTAWLTQRRFEPYHSDFRDVSSADPSDPHQLAQFVLDLSKQPKSYFEHKLHSLREKLLHNRRTLEKYIDSQKNKMHQGLPRE